MCPPFPPSAIPPTDRTSKSLLDDVINTVNVLADRALDSVERLLLSLPPQKLGFAKPKASSKSKQPQGQAEDDETGPAEAAKAEIESGTHQLETLLNAAIDKNFDVFELYVMQNILIVKPQDQSYMRLSHYRDLDFSFLNNDNLPDRPTNESVTNLRRRVQASQRLHIALEAERAKNEAFLEKLRSVLGVPAGAALKRERQGEGTGDQTGDTQMEGSAFGFLRNRGDLETGSAEKPLTTTTEFTLSQLQSLRSLSKSLRTILPELSAKDDDGNDDDGAVSKGKRSWRKDRMEYVEGSSRKYLERTAGLELGAQGEVRDGEWQGEGKELTRGEVEGLERIAGMLDKTGRKEGGQTTGQDVDGDEAMQE